MVKRFNHNYMALLLLLDVVAIQVALSLAWIVRHVIHIGVPRPEELLYQGPSLELQIFAGALGLVFLISLQVYTPRKVIRWIDELQRVVAANTLACLSLTGVLYLASLDLPRLGFAYFFVLSTVLLVGYRWLFRLWHRWRQRDPGVLSRILVLGAGTAGIEIAREFWKQRWPGLQVVGFLDDDPAKQAQECVGLPVLGPLNSVVQLVKTSSIDEVIFALPVRYHERVSDLVVALYELPVRVRVIPGFLDLSMHGAKVDSLGGIPLIGLRDPAIDGVQRLFKRLMDLLLSSAALLVASPVFLITAIAIKLEDGGPIFYGSERVGENGHIFRMWKFRSMVVGADRLGRDVLPRDATGTLIHKFPEDPRVTRVGRFIRRLSIDELPQLFNVMRGDMSLVGPRPELPWMVERYQTWQRKRFAVPQGITGWWQISGRSDLPMHLSTDHDLYYIQNYSIWLDIQILWRTVGVVVSGKGAY